MSFTTGRELRLTLFGSSHGQSVGGTLDGLPSGTKVDLESIARWLDYRKPGSSAFTSQRKEIDTFQIVSGISGGYTDGGPVTMIIENKDAISRHYDRIKEVPRPGHSDISQFYKYGDFRVTAGGGFFSGRMTAPIVGLSSIALNILNMNGVTVTSYIDNLGGIKLPSGISPGPLDAYAYKSRVPDNNLDAKATELLKSAMASGESIGAAVATRIDGIPPGVGEPFFSSVESVLSSLMFSIPGLKGIEFGAGFGFAGKKGSEVVDEFARVGGKIETRTNHNGGILGGITIGMPVLFRVVMKPTSSIRKELRSISLVEGGEKKLRIEGRHDPCIAIRAVPVIQTLTAYGILDLILSAKEPEINLKFR
ncbi:MAG: chorismate synthase [Candidatus Thermoplasmatota archaeon]|nr:chorismate synthase [Candidatus Thermoplasmatota archaeon]MCL5437688.1 chorismate synthase [Candidatus Thermoplasmatota archaeon]